jgi:nucleoside phosphorylase
MALQATKGTRSAVILCALPKEVSAVLAHLESVEETVVDGTVVTVGTFKSELSTWTVRVAETGKGNAVASVTTERMIKAYDPEVALFVGIAGGLKKDLSVGDVVVASTVFGYHGGKAGKQRFLIRPQVRVGSYALRQRASAEARKGTWTSLTPNAAGSPEAHVEPIVSGEQVVASTSSPEYKFIAANFSAAYAIEMEGEGFYAAAEMNEGHRCLVIRGLMDLLDGKNLPDEEIRKKRAAENAAAFAFNLLATYSGPTDETRRSPPRLCRTSSLIEGS